MSLFLTLLFCISCNSWSSSDNADQVLIDPSGDSADVSLSDSARSPVENSSNKVISEQKEIAKIVREQSSPSPAKSEADFRQVQQEKKDSGQQKTETDQSKPQILLTDIPEHTGGIPVPEPTMVILDPVFDHDQFHALLQKYVQQGKVNYQGLKQEEAKLDAYLENIQRMVPTNDWSRNAQLAYWINVYNSFTLKLILDHHPVKSIMDLHGGKPWDVKWIDIGGQTHSLNDIEHQIIRPTFKDARIHFAVNCAARSCPPLANKAYTAENVQALLDQSAREFINNQDFNILQADQVNISKIFEWYAEDFGDIISYLNKYSNHEISAEAKVNYQEYNWQLNN